MQARSWSPIYSPPSHLTSNFNVHFPFPNFIVSSSDSSSTNNNRGEQGRLCHWHVAQSVHSFFFFLFISFLSWVCEDRSSLWFNPKIFIDKKKNPMSIKNENFISKKKKIKKLRVKSKYTKNAIISIFFLI